MRKAHAIAGILAAAGVTSIIISAGVLGETALTLTGTALLVCAASIRTIDLRRKVPGRVPWSLTIIALAVPPTDALNYLRELGSSVGWAHRRDRARHTWNFIVMSPVTLATLWGGWFRTRLVKLTISALSTKVNRVTARERPAAVRRLRRYCRLIVFVTGQRQYENLAAAARALHRACSQEDEDTLPSEEIDDLITAMADWRPDRA